ncbi:kinase-like protein [Pholiota conissans]|uniref:Kinase-like protein n=1 Tax=Pholiota conissans TaxID=109636 RepID=A0A9P6CUS6_9AGAR|nr:kinase-like protein [Pholiota conissans]
MTHFEVNEHFRWAQNGGRQPGRVKVWFRRRFFDEEPVMFVPEDGFGYNPLSIGDRLTERSQKGHVYEVVRKLGYGDSSSTWLVRSDGEPRFLALKVMIVNASLRNFDNEDHELRSTFVVTKKNPKHPGYAHCLPMRDFTVCTSYHGLHMALAFDVMASGVYSLQKTLPYKVFTPRNARRIVKQVLLALQYMHEECGLVHTDLRLSNIMVPVTASDTRINKYLAQNPAKTYKPRVDLKTKKLITTVKSQPLPHFGLNPSLNNLSIKLCDYGKAIPIQKIDHRNQDQCSHILPILRAPEIILGHPWSTPVDIWSVGFLVFKLLTDNVLYPLHALITADRYKLAHMVNYMGAFPQRFLAKCTMRNSYFDPEGNPTFPNINISPLKEHVTFILGAKGVSTKEARSVAAFMERCLALDPAARPSATELLRHEWLCDI